MRTYFILFVSAIASLSCFAGEEKTLTVSVIIPCHYKHAPLLVPLLDAYREQTVLPDEIVISLSEADKVAPDLLESLGHFSWPFTVKVAASNKKMLAGENRNAACKEANGDIFICQDADDLPHPQRVEAIVYFFSAFGIDHLMHSWEGENLPAIMYDDMSCIEYFLPKSYLEAWNAYQVHNGNVAISRRVFQVVHWPASTNKGEDIIFNKRVYKHFQKRIVVNAPLITYRGAFSTANGRCCINSH